jgi:hypothetical protein
MLCRGGYGSRQGCCVVLWWAMLTAVKLPLPSHDGCSQLGGTWATALFAWAEFYNRHVTKDM